MYKLKNKVRATLGIYVLAYGVLSGINVPAIEPDRIIMSNLPESFQTTA